MGYISMIELFAEIVNGSKLLIRLWALFFVADSYPSWHFSAQS